MSQRFIRCTHCGLPHDVNVVVCPMTKKALRRSSASQPQVNVVKRSPSQPPAKVPSSPPPAATSRRQQPSSPAVGPRGSSSPAAGSRGPASPGVGGRGAASPAAGSRGPASPAAGGRGTVARAAPPASAAPRSRSTRDLVGRVLGEKYLVKSVLGEGGMGTVFEAEHISLRRPVAVKVLHPAEAKKKEAVKRFHQEARAAGSIGHPNICEVYDFGTLEDGSPYLVMEKLVGRTLSDRIQSEGGLPFDDVIDVLVQVLSGLIAAHEKGVVHRDIKPENVFITVRAGIPPVVKVLDFGVSKMIHPVLSGDREEDLDLTRTGMVMGTPYYMAPEQARGDRNLDARVDLWACGVILYEAITGRRPFTAANYNALLLQILTTKPRPARELRPAMPAGFDEVIDRALARSREDRYSSGAEFQRDLLTLKKRMAVDVTAVTRLAPPPSSARARSSRRAPRSQPEEPARRPPSVRPPPTPPEDDIHELSDSSVEIPVTFSVDTPMSGELAPVLDPRVLSDQDGERPTRLPSRRPVPSQAPLYDPDDDATQIGFHLPIEHEGETTRRHGSELDAALADARHRLLKDTFPQSVAVPPPPPPSEPPYAEAGKGYERQGRYDGPNEGYAPAPAYQAANAYTGPPAYDPSSYAAAPPRKTYGSVPPPPSPNTRWSSDLRRQESSVPAPPPPPRPERRGVLNAPEEDVDDEAYTQILSNNLSPLRFFDPSAPGADDTVKMDGEPEERLPDATERLLYPEGKKRPRR